jgi:hypothetical protein
MGQNLDSGREILSLLAQMKSPGLRDGMTCVESIEPLRRANELLLISQEKDSASPELHSIFLLSARTMESSILLDADEAMEELREMVRSWELTREQWDEVLYDPPSLTFLFRTAFDVAGKTGSLRATAFNVSCNGPEVSDDEYDDVGDEYYGSSESVFITAAGLSRRWRGTLTELFQTVTELPAR